MLFYPKRVAYEVVFSSLKPEASLRCRLENSNRFRDCRVKHGTGESGSSFSRGSKRSGERGVLNCMGTSFFCNRSLIFKSKKSRWCIGGIIYSATALFLILH